MRSGHSRLLVEVLDPLNVAAVLPDTHSARAIHFNESASSVLLSVEPLAVVDTPIFPFEDSSTLSLVIDEEALILLAISPL